MVRRDIKQTVTKVIHRHRVGSQTFCRVSELTLVEGRPAAVIHVINIAGVLTPLFTVELDPARLRRAAGAPHIAFYAGETRDPRYEEAGPSSSSTISAQAR
jgi:hypothetical protein